MPVLSFQVKRALQQEGFNRKKRGYRDINEIYINMNDPLFTKQWYLINTGQANGTPGLDLNVAEAWELGYTGKGVTIGIMDDGIDYLHPDLASNYASTITIRRASLGWPAGTRGDDDRLVGKCSPSCQSLERGHPRPPTERQEEAEQPSRAPPKSAEPQATPSSKQAPPRSAELPTCAQPRSPHSRPNCRLMSDTHTCCYTALTHHDGFDAATVTVTHTGPSSWSSHGN
ncbi:hypothetical protein J1605_003200 [Eschrichtius robustus]|uniref:Proprotein convertase 2 n=1 Tax=Eschrichtius robustus TaxID=9764 RepID=A0AB34HQE0_ESCRO|nr:hypothetical protein J1605_003200 [Eschrichtius robustus]